MHADEDILAATRAEICAFGLRRSTMTSVARRAGVSRATLYRRAASLEELVQDALVAEFEDMLSTSVASAGGLSRRADIVTAARAMLECLGRNLYVHALLDHDPELILSYLVDRLGRSQELILVRLRGAIDEAQRQGSVRTGDPDVLAAGVLQALTPFVVSLRLLEGIAERTVWFDEAAHLVDAYLRPDERPVS